MPTAALFRHDLRTLWGSWLVQIWVIATVLLTFFLMTANWGQFQSAPLIGTLLFPYLVFPWFLIAVVFGGQPGFRLTGRGAGRRVLEPAGHPL